MYKKDSFDEAKEARELKLQRQKEIDQRINMVFNGEDDEEFRKALMEDENEKMSNANKSSHAFRISNVSQARSSTRDDPEKFKL